MVARRQLHAALWTLSGLILHHLRVHGADVLHRSMQDVHIETPHRWRERPLRQQTP
jgi:hypothetical protein